MIAPLPPTEPERLRALMSCELLDTRATPEFDQITALAAETFGVPVALISLVDAERQWFKSSHGLDLTETPRSQAFCAYTILDHAPLVVPDARLDPRFADNPLVTGTPGIRFYAGAPLTTREGYRLGSLCLLDFAPRSFSEADTARLARLASVAMTAVEAHHTTRQLRAVEQRFQRIAEHAPGMVYQFVRRADGSGHFPFVSAACREILELEPETLQQNADAYFQLVPREEHAARDAAVAASRATLQPLRWEGRHMLPSGRTKCLQISARPERRPNGDTIWDGILLDVTERRQTEERLWMLESSVENANDAVIITEAEPIDEPGPRIIYANQAFARMSGHSVASVIGKTPRMFQGPKTDPETKATIRRALRRWKPVRVEILNYRQDGSEFWVELNIVPVANEHGWYTHWVSVQRDVTERKAVEQELKLARDEAQRANRAKSEFLSRMSHELRTPLNAILGFGQLLEMSNPTSFQQESITHVLRGGRHLLGLINEVLDISRIESGKMEFELEAVPVARTLELTASLLQPLAQGHGITLEVAPGHRALEGAAVQADPQRFKQVLLNLLSNAIKYNRPGGRATLACEPAATTNRLRVTVRDTGPGIAAADLPKLFSPFERLGAANSDIEGTGIGLVISKRLVEAMGGTISVESTVGRGSTFSVELPMSDSADGEAEEQDSSEETAQSPFGAGPGPRTVLCIDDNFSNLELIKAVLLPRKDLTLLAAKRADAGLKLARERGPDLILLDLHLPDMSGEVVLTLLKEDPRTRHVPVVMVSADATGPQVEHLLGLGAHAYLTKPFQITSLMQAVDEALAVGR